MPQQRRAAKINLTGFREGISNYGVTNHLNNLLLALLLRRVAVGF
jgi:hypothetical protein